MSNSLYGGFVDYNTSLLGANQPVDSMLWPVLFNNALHFADSEAHVRVAFSHATINARTPFDTTSWLLVETYGPWAHRLDAQGVPYPMRFRIAGSASQAAAIHLKLRVSSASSADRATASNTGLVSTSSTSAAWLTPSSGPESLLTFTSADAADALTNIDTVDGVGGDPVGIETCQMVATVWGRATGSVSAVPQLRGLYLAEFIASGVG